MITQFFLDFLLNLVTPILSLLPTINLSYTGAVQPFQIFIANVLYFLPAKTILIIFDVVFSLMVIRCVIAFLKTIWSILPIL